MLIVINYLIDENAGINCFQKGWLCGVVAIPGHKRIPAVGSSAGAQNS